MTRSSPKLVRYYRSLKYSDLQKGSCGSIREAFNLFVPFVSKLSKDLHPFFAGAGKPLTAADEMAASILSSASGGKYGQMTDREMLACLQVQRIQKILKSVLILCANYVGDDTEEVLEEEKYMVEVDDVRDALEEAVVALRIIALPLTNP